MNKQLRKAQKVRARKLKVNRKRLFERRKLKLAREAKRATQLASS